MRPPPRALLVLAAALCACGPPRIRVAYPASDTPEDVAAAKALSQLYVVFCEEDGEQDLGVFAAAFDEALRARGGALLAYRAAPPGPDPFRAELAPSALLEVDLSYAPLTRSDFDKEVKTQDSEGKEQTRKEPYTRVARRLDAHLRLSAPGAAAPLEKSVWVVESDEKPRDEAKKTSDAHWERRFAEKLARAAAKRAASALPAPRALTRERALHVDKEDPASKEASYKAQEGAWEEASALWATKLDGGTGGWRELWNLAVAAEQRKAYAEAERLFKKSAEAAGTDPAASGASFAEAAADAARGALLFARSEAAAAFFARPLAVLPFSDDTTSVDGPANLRKMTAEALTRGGYAALDLEDVDRALRRHGYSQGGQLKRGKPRDFAAWTGAERLVYGDITEFRNVMLGFFGSREVEGSLRLWDAAAAADVYVSTKSATSREGTLDGAAATGRLAGQLGKALLEAWTHTPLGAESALWVVRSLQGLPLRPPRR